MHKKINSRTNATNVLKKIHNKQKPARTEKQTRNN